VGRQESLALGDELASLCAPLSRPLAEAWRDLPAPWRELAAGLEPQARAVTLAVDADRRTHEVAPARPFRAFELVAPQDVRLVLIGQDPYPLPGDATGLAFSCVRGVPASMRNVYAALEAAVPGFVRPRAADLEPWARQGVLLLNAALTVRMGKKMAGSHLQMGWQAWTGGVLRALYERRLQSGEPVPVAWLWGKPASAFFDAALNELDVPQQRVLRARHPAQDFKREFVGQAAEHLRRLEQLLQPPLRW
jgi:uracil-DNA glycosylase